MRTTVTIDDHLLDRAKRRARERGVSLGDVVEESLQLLFTMPGAARPPAALPVFDGGGFLPGIDPHSNASLFDAMDEEEFDHRAGRV